MKKLWFVFTLCLILSGCSMSSFEHVEDVYAPGIEPVKQEIKFDVPKDAAAETIQSDFGRLYFCDGYEIMVQTFLSGDIQNTVRELTGYDRSALTVISSNRNGLKCYECVWTAAAEQGDSVGRVVILDDGSYHYCVSVMANENEAGALQETWRALLSSVTVQS